VRKKGLLCFLCGAKVLNSISEMNFRWRQGCHTDSKLQTSGSAFDGEIQRRKEKFCREKEKKRRRDGSYLISSRRKGYEVEKTSENLTDGMKESTFRIP